MRNLGGENRKRRQAAALHKKAFTLVELLIVVAIIAILAAIAVPNMREATRRAETAACACNLKAIASALAMYRVDWNKLPLADGSAGKEDSRAKTKFGDGPASNGFWSGVPNALVDLGYLGSREYLFCPSLKKQYRERGEHLRYAYNAAANDAFGLRGADWGHPIDGAGATGQKVWIARCLMLNTKAWAPNRYVAYPHGPDPDPKEGVWGDENVLWNDLSVAREHGSAP